MPKGPATHPPTTAESRRALGKHWWMGATGERCFFSWQHEEEEETFGFWHEPDVAKTTTTKKGIGICLSYRKDQGTGQTPDHLKTLILHFYIRLFIFALDYLEAESFCLWPGCPPISFLSYHAPGHVSKAVQRATWHKRSVMSWLGTVPCHWIFGSIRQHIPQLQQRFVASPLLCEPLCQKFGQLLKCDWQPAGEWKTDTKCVSIPGCGIRRELTSEDLSF